VFVILALACSVMAVAAEPVSRPLSRSAVTRALPSPKVRAEAAIVYDAVTNEVLWESHAQEPRSIASITKVMTAVVYLDEQSELSRDAVISRSDVWRASTTYLRAGERATVGELLHLALIASDNAAARALARVSPWGTREFVRQMNEKAAELGLGSTQFADPSGLDEANVSSAYDLSRLIAYAVRNPRIAAIMQKRQHRVHTSRRRVTIRNTNRLLEGNVAIRGGKTGYLNEAGYCLVALVELPQGHPVAVVVLGARSNAGRFAEVRRLVTWVSTTGRTLLTPARADK
jgi:D-alanyl-D-alanine endopeptidase (penicillin-binding protein 7)